MSRLGCWRCEREFLPSQLVHDPMMPPQDTIGVCPSCAIERREVARWYLSAGKKLVPRYNELD